MGENSNPFDSWGGSENKPTTSDVSSGESTPARPFDYDREERKVTTRLVSVAGVAAAALALYAAAGMFDHRPKRDARMMAAMDTDVAPRKPSLIERLFCTGLSRPSFCGSESD